MVKAGKTIVIHRISLINKHFLKFSFLQNKKNNFSYLYKKIRFFLQTTFLKKLYCSVHFLSKGYFFDLWSGILKIHCGLNTSALTNIIKKSVWCLYTFLKSCSCLPIYPFAFLFCFNNVLIAIDCKYCFIWVANNVVFF